MSEGGGLRRARHPPVWLAFFVATSLLATLSLSVSAQVAGDTIPTDSAPRDTLLVPIPPEAVGGDTIPEALRAEAASMAGMAEIPLMPGVGAPGWGSARWEWGPEELARLPGLTVLEFLELLPGMTTFRPGGFGRPIGLTAMGMGGGRVRVILDGFEMDPLGANAFEIETLALLDLESIRVERSLSEIRIEIRTFRMPEPEPFSTVELGTGVFQTRVLRAILARGFGDHSVATGAFDLGSTGGIGIREQYRHSSAVFRWSAAPAPGSGLQLEWRRTAIDRAGTVYPRETARTDLVVRGRQELGDRITTEALVGRAFEEDREAERRLEVTQGALRGIYSAPSFSAEAAIRGRSLGEGGAPLAGSEAEARLAWLPTSSFGLELASRRMAGSDLSAVDSRAMAMMTPIAGFTVFGSGEFGSRLVPRVEHQPALPSGSSGASGELVVADATGWRAGAELAAGASAVGVAAFATGASPSIPFGLPFDGDGVPVVVERSTGLETYLVAGVPRTDGAVRLEGWYTYFPGEAVRPYTPVDLGRAALVFQGVFFEGQLEPILRVEGVRRGRARVFSAAGQPSATAPVSHRLNLSLQIRILDVEAFLFWDNLLADPAAIDLPGAPAGSSRIVYGASWRFRD